jgi:ABC-2 type transport system permease protein
MTNNTATLRKWRAIFSIYFQDGLAYRASGLIWITTDLVTAVTMPLVWATAQKSGGQIAGFTSSDFVLYYLCMLLVGSFVTSHMMWEIAMEVKEGQFSTALLRPISFYQLTFLRNISWRVIRLGLFLPFFLALLLVYRSFLGGATIYLGWELWVSVFLGHLVSFNFVMMMGLIALYTEEVFSIFELYYIPMLFLSGQLFPISVMPEWAQNISRVLPFYFTTGAPTEILIGRVSGAQALNVIGMQLFWIAVCYLGFRFLWSRGLKHYTAVGM